MHKRKSKKAVILCVVIIAAFLVLSMSSALADTANGTIKDIPDLYGQVRKGYNMGRQGPISMVKATMQGEQGNKDIYLVMLSGTEMVSGQATDFKVDMLSAAGKDNDYLKNVVNTITSNAPKGSNLVVAGHSLGGMIAQQVSTNSTIKDGYNILNIIGIGSPLINPTGREGTVVRLGDTKDSVPSMTSCGAQFPKENAELCKENGGFSNSLSAHTGSYSKKNVWGQYDAVGKKGGNTTISFDTGAVKFYKCPSGAKAGTAGTSGSSSGNGGGGLFSNWMNMFNKNKTNNSTNTTNPQQGN